jgi:hypothetical protein
MRSKSRDYFAELYVAGLMADAGWNVYFPHRDRGLDFIISKTGSDGREIIRPVQVKGKYPMNDKGDQRLYGYVGELNQIHRDMVLAIPYFSVAAPGPAIFVAYLPFWQIKPHQRGYRCQPACFLNGCPKTRPSYSRYFDAAGLALIEEPKWGEAPIPSTSEASRIDED